MEKISDYCPYCGQEIEIEKILDVVDGDVQDVSIKCPNCEKHIRISVNITTQILLLTEEDYLESLLKSRERFKNSLELDILPECKNVYKNMIKCLNIEIDRCVTNVRFNKRRRM